MAERQQTTPAAKSAVQRRIDELHDHSQEAGTVATSALVGFGATESPFARTARTGTSSNSQ